MDYFDLNIGLISFHSDSYVDDQFIESLVTARLDSYVKKLPDSYHVDLVKFKVVSVEEVVVDVMDSRSEFLDYVKKKMYLFIVQIFYVLERFEHE